MQKTRYIIALGVLLLAGCAQFGSKNEAPSAATNVSASAETAKPDVKDTASVTAGTSGKTSEHTLPVNNATVKVLTVGGSSEATATETTVVSTVIDKDQPMTYKVEIGDSLYSIARKNNISMTCLAKANKITDPNRLAAGQTLVIPKPNDC